MHNLKQSVGLIPFLNFIGRKEYVCECKFQFSYCPKNLMFEMGH